MLDADPKDVEAFRGLLRSLKPGESRDDVGERFLKLEASKQWLESLAQECRKNGNDAETLHRLARAIKAIDPQAPRVDQYLMRARLWAGKTDEATKFLREALKSAATARAKKGVREEYLRGMARAGKTLEAYRAFPGGVESFRILAEQLAGRGDLKGLEKLIGEHDVFFDDDPNLNLYRGHLAFEAANWAQADAAWTAAFRQIQDDEIRDTFRRRWVRARFALGKVMEALRDIPPVQATYTQLSDLCLEHKQEKTLMELLKSDDKSVGYRRSHAVELLLKMYPDADFATHVKLAENRTPSLGTAEEFVVSFWAAQGKGIAVYEIAGDKRKAFEKLSESLLDFERYGDVRRLVELHRKADPMDPEIDLVEGVLLVHRHQPEKALERLAGARGFKPPYFTVRKFRFKQAYIEAAYQSGQGLKLLQEEVAVDSLAITTVGVLSRLFKQNHDAAGLEALVKARPQRGFVYRAWEDQVLAKAFAGKLDDALALHAAARKETMSPAADPLKKKGFGGFGRNTELENKLAEQRKVSFKISERDVMGTMWELGHGMDFYRAAAFPEEAFATLAGLYLRNRNLPALERLLKEHRGKFPDDAELPIITANLELLRGNAETAEELITAELVKPAPAKQTPGRLTLRSGPPRPTLFKPLVIQGRTVELYRRAGGDAEVFRHLAKICVDAKEATELAALLDAHRRRHPQDSELRRYQAELHFFQGDYRAAFEIFRVLPIQQRTATEPNKAIACLVRSKRFEEAVRLAREWEQDGQLSDATPLLLAHAAAGDVKETTRLMEIRGKRFTQRQQFYADEDLSPLLQSARYEALRERFPEPKKRD